jgi:hypothetical protein
LGEVQVHGRTSPPVLNSHFYRSTVEPLDALAPMVTPRLADMGLSL